MIRFQDGEAEELLHRIGAVKQRRTRNAARLKRAEAIARARKRRDIELKAELEDLVDATYEARPLFDDARPSYGFYRDRDPRPVPAPVPAADGPHPRRGAGRRQGADQGEGAVARPAPEAGAARGQDGQEPLPREAPAPPDVAHPEGLLGDPHHDHPVAGATPPPAPAQGQELAAGDGRLFRIFYDHQPTGGWLLKAADETNAREWLARNIPGDADARIEAFEPPAKAMLPFNPLHDATRGDLVPPRANIFKEEAKPKKSRKPTRQYDVFGKVEGADEWIGRVLANDEADASAQARSYFPAFLHVAPAKAKFYGKVCGAWASEQELAEALAQGVHLVALLARKRDRAAEPVIEFDLEALLEGESEEDTEEVLDQDMRGPKLPHFAVSVRGRDLYYVDAIDREAAIRYAKSQNPEGTDVVVSPAAELPERASGQWVSLQRATTPEDDYLAAKEVRARYYIDRGEGSPCDHETLRQVVGWRLRVERGDAEPTWEKASEFDVTLADGHPVRVVYEAEKREGHLLGHLDFHGPMTETGYRSEFARSVDIDKPLRDWAEDRARRYHAESRADIARELKRKKIKLSPPAAGPKPKAKSKAAKSIARTHGGSGPDLQAKAEPVTLDDAIGAVLSDDERWKELKAEAVAEVQEADPEGEAAGPTPRAFAVTTSARVAKGGPPIYYVRAATMGQAEDYVRANHPADWKGVVLPHEGPIPAGSHVTAAKEATPDPKAPTGQASGPGATAASPGSSGASTDARSGKNPRSAPTSDGSERAAASTPSESPRTSPRTGSATPSSGTRTPRGKAARSTETVILRSEDGPIEVPTVPGTPFTIMAEKPGHWNKCRACAGDHSHPAARPTPGACHRPHDEVRAIRDIAAEWREASLWEMDLPGDLGRYGIDSERIDTVGKLNDYIEMFGSPAINEARRELYQALIDFKDQVERNHQAAEASRAKAHTKPKARDKARTRGTTPDARA